VPEKVLVNKILKKENRRSALAALGGNYLITYLAMAEIMQIINATVKCMPTFTSLLGSLPGLLNICAKATKSQNRPTNKIIIGRYCISGLLL
jgi:hypothetical protein